jgi:hypothetical protein
MSDEGKHLPRVPERTVQILAVALAQVFYVDASYTDFK